MFRDERQPLGAGSAFLVIGVGIGLSSATIPVIALDGAKPDEAGSASGPFSSIQQLASAIGSAAVTSIFFQAATSGLVHSMEVTLVVVLALTVLSLPIVALMAMRVNGHLTRTGSALDWVAELIRRCLGHSLWRGGVEPFVERTARYG